MENAVDAGATSIQLIVSDAGKALIQVIDNGKGMSVTDARLSVSVENHLENRTERKCWTCHQEVPHGSVHSLSSVKYYGKIDEEHQETVPQWLNKYIKESDNQNDKKDE